MSKTFQSALERLCEEARRASSDAKRDGIIERLWLEFVRQGRSTLVARKRLVDPGLCAGVTNLPSGEILQAAAGGVYSWYESEFEEAAKKFRKLDQRLGGQKNRSFPAECCSLFRVHLLTWAAAAETRSGDIKTGRQLLQQSRGLLESYGENDVPNCWGWYHAEVARVAFWDDDLETAHREYTRAQQCFAQADNRFALGEIAGARARLFTHESNYHAALEEIARSARWLKDPLDRAKAAFHTGRVFRYQRQYDEALRSLRSGLEFVKDVGNKRWEAHLRDVLGDVYIEKAELEASCEQSCREQGDLKTAEEHHRHEEAYLASARGEFSSSACRRSRDPMIRTQSDYQQAKLKLAEAMARTSPSSRDRSLRSVLTACDRLKSSSGRRMLREKALMLKGRACLPLRDFGEAGRALTIAARGFRRHGAHWYAAEAALLLGEVRVNQGNLAKAGQDWSAGLEEARDENQRRRLLEKIRLHIADIDPMTLCQALGALSVENASLAAILDSYRQFSQKLHTLFGEMTAQMRGIGALPHIAGALETLRASTSVDVDQEPLLEKLEVAYNLVSILLQCQTELVSKWNTETRHPAWVPLHTVLDSVAIHLRKRDADGLRKRPDVGVYTDQDVLVDALQAGHDFLESWGGAARATCRLSESESLVTVDFRTTRLAIPGRVADLVVSHLPSPTCLAECRVDPARWAALAWTAIRLRSIGGEVSLHQGEPRAGDRREYHLEFRIPYDTIPFWKL